MNVKQLSIYLDLTKEEIGIIFDGLNCAKKLYDSEASDYELECAIAIEHLVAKIEEQAGPLLK